MVRPPPLAKKPGLADSIVADLRANRRPVGMGSDEEVVYDFVTDLTTKHALSDELLDLAKKLLGEQQVVDLTAVAGTYVAVADPADGRRGCPRRQRAAFQGRRTLSDGR
jgi:4-carboxymuconolactone decarboxylase